MYLKPSIIIVSVAQEQGPTDMFMPQALSMVHGHYDLESMGLLGSWHKKKYHHTNTILLKAIKSTVHEHHNLEYVDPWYTKKDHSTNTIMPKAFNYSPQTPYFRSLGYMGPWQKKKCCTSISMIT